MKMNRSILFGLVVGVSALAFSSCAYDPYYAGGYGDGYGYGGSGFSTSYFVSTGSSRWAYDPYAGAYYDYTRRCYYDPYLNGYYPIGYRPRYVYGAPHPHGWSRGSSYCPPPSNIRSYSLTNYRDRGERYRSLGRSWSSDVRVSSTGRNQRSGYGDRDQRSGYGDRDRGNSRSDSMQRSSRDGSSSRSGSVFGGRSGGSDTRDFSPQRSGNVQPDIRSRSRESDARSSRSGSYGRGFSPEAFTRSSGDGGSRDSSNRSARSAPQIQRQAPQVERQAPQIERRAPQMERQAPQFERRAPQPERQAPQFERREGSGGRDNDDSDRGGRGRIRGLGEG